MSLKASLGPVSHSRKTVNWRVVLGITSAGLYYLPPNRVHPLYEPGQLPRLIRGYRIHISPPRRIRSHAYFCEEVF